MKNNKNKSGTISLCAAMIFAGLTGTTVNAAPIVLDPFTTDQQAIWFPIANFRSNPATAASASVEAVGTHRVLAVEKVKGSNSENIIMAAGNGTLKFSESNDTAKGKGLASYTGTSIFAGVTGANFNKPSSYSLGGIDLTGGLNFAALFFQAKADNVGLPITFSFYGGLNASNQRKSATKTIILSGGNAYKGYEIRLASFTAANLSAGETVLDIFRSVRAFTIEFDGTPNYVEIGTDATLRNLVTGVPEPASFTLLASSLAGLVIVRRLLRR